MTLIRNELIKECPMAKPKDVFYYIEPLFDGKTSEQIFQEKLEKGIIKYVGKTTKVVEEKQYLEPYRLDGKPRKFKITKINIFLQDIYKEETMTYTRNSELIASYTPEEYALLENKNGRD